MYLQYQHVDILATQKLVRFLNYLVRLLSPQQSLEAKDDEAVS